MEPRGWKAMVIRQQPGHRSGCVFLCKAEWRGWKRAKGRGKFSGEAGKQPLLMPGTGEKRLTAVTGSKRLWCQARSGCCCNTNGPLPLSRQKSAWLCPFDCLCQTGYVGTWTQLSCGGLDSLTLPLSCPVLQNKLRRN